MYQRSIQTIAKTWDLYATFAFTLHRYRARALLEQSKWPMSRSRNLFDTLPASLEHLVVKPKQLDIDKIITNVKR